MTRRSWIILALIVAFIAVDPISWLVYWIELIQWHAANPNHGSPY